MPLTNEHSSVVLEMGQVQAAAEDFPSLLNVQHTAY